MPSALERQRGIRLGVYHDPEKAAREERQVQVQEQRANLADEREIRAGANDNERTRLDKLRFERAELTARAAESAEARVLEDSINATKELSGILASTPDYPMQRQKIIGKYPRALADKAFQEQAQWNDGIHKEWSTQKAVSDKMIAEQRAKDAAIQAEKLAIATARNESLDRISKMTGARPKSATVGVNGEPSVTFEFGGDAQKPAKPDSWEQLYSDTANAIKMYQDTPTKTVPTALDAQFQARRAALTGTSAPVPVASGAVASQAEYDALPSGAEFNFNGRRGRKP